MLIEQTKLTKTKIVIVCVFLFIKKKTKLLYFPLFRLVFKKRIKQ